MVPAKPRMPWPIGPWTAIKLEHLEAYLRAYARATTRAQERYYIDGFAGCGDCVLRGTRVPVQGSVWRALSVTPPFTRCFFVERDPVLAAHLSAQMDKYPQVEVFQGDCNIVIPTKVLQRVPRRAPSLCFLDPTGAQVRWDTIKALAAHRVGPRKMELLILYPFDMFVARWLSLPKMERRLTDLYGDASWKHELRESVRLREGRDQRRGRFVSLYARRLQDLGYSFVDAHGPLYRGHRALYHFVFATDHPAGHKIMSDVWRRARPIPGELGYKPRLLP
jgi:three-Cys-motif partner protein